MALVVRIIREEAGLVGLKRHGPACLASRQTGTIFASFPWNLAWWHAFGGGKRLFVLVATDESGQVRGIAPLMLRQAGLLRKLEFIGTGLSDTGDFVLDASRAEKAAQAIFACLRRNRREWDLLDMDEVPAYSPMAGSWQEKSHRACIRLAASHRLPLYRATRYLGGIYEDFAAQAAAAPGIVCAAGCRRRREHMFRLVTEEADAPRLSTAFTSSTWRDGRPRRVR